MAEGVPAGSNGVLYTPWIWGERAPVDERTLRAGIYNLSLHNTRADVVRAVFEGVALNARWLLGPVERFMGHKVEGITLVGGGGNSDVWCQILADVLDVPVRQVHEPILANARGAALIAAATGHAVEVDPRLRERHYGVLEGLTVDEIQRRYPEVLARLKDNDPDYVVPGGESHRQHYRRNVAGLEAIGAARGGSVVALVVHGGVLDSVFRYVARLPVEQPRCSISRVGSAI